jgi:hypothetical protein
VLKALPRKSDSRAVERGNNGGFPEPFAGEAVRVVSSRHEGCGAATRVRIPHVLPTNAVRRVVCEGCRERYECDGVDEVAVDPGGVAAPPRRPRLRAPRLPRIKAPGWLSNPQSHAWRYLSVPLAAAAVVGILFLIQGSGGSARHSASSTAPAKPGHSQGAGGDSSAPGSGAKVVKGSSFTVALPSGWERTEPKNGATFAAKASDGGADATLWIRRDPSLGFPQFEARSLAQLHALAGSAHVVNRVAAPTPEGTVVTLAADSPPGQPAYEVTLRVAGPYRYYLATTVDPNASRAAVDGADLLHNSFVPLAGSGG